MLYKSVFPPLDIPNGNILSYLYPPNEPLSDKPIWIDAANPSHSLSPQQSLAWIRQLGFGLDQLGIQKGRVVLVLSPNHIFVPVAYLGIIGSGRIFSGANPAYTVSELEHQIRNTEAALLLVHPTLVANAIVAAGRAGLKKGSILLFSDNKCTAPVDGVNDWRTIIGTEEEGRSWKWDSIATDARTVVATINYSSGSTGLPKGVCISHGNLIANVEQTIYMRDQATAYTIAGEPRPQERWMAFLPMYHAYGQIYACLMAPRLGVPVYVMREFTFDKFLNVIQEYRITHLQVAPPILIMLNKRPETKKYNLRSLRSILCGAAPLSRELQNDTQKRFNVLVIQAWGMTEVTCGAIYVPGGKSDETGSVGMLAPNCECRLISESGNPAGPGQPGELYVRGPNVCLRYWRNGKATAESIDSEGWLKTGDIAVVRKNWFWIVDRKKELIKVNALQVAPAELEAVLLTHDDIADAGVVGIRITEGEERPRAYICLKPGRSLAIEKIQDYMKGRLARHKQLTGGIKLVSHIPRLPSGKIQRVVLKQWAEMDSVSGAKL